MKKKWVYYIQQHFCILFQIITTNIVEIWHYLLKFYTSGKKVIETFIYLGVVSYILNIGNLEEQQTFKFEKLWFETQVVKYTKYLKLV